MTSLRVSSTAGWRPFVGDPIGPSCTATDVTSVIDNDALAEASFHHDGAEGSGVEVHESLMHDRRARRKVCSETDPIGICDAYARRDDVVQHPRKPVD